jgi:signal peptidase I
MLSPTILVAALLSAIVLPTLLWAVFLRLGLQWAKVPEPTWRRVATATLLVAAIQLIVNVLVVLFAADFVGGEILALLAALASSVLVPCLVIRQVFATSFVKSLQAWLATLLATGATVLFGVFIWRPFITEAFVSPTNAMAPTLLGRHWHGVCPECGRPNYCSPVDADDAPYAPRETRMICENFHIAQVSDAVSPVARGDRFLVAKFLAPRRWDIVVFRYPAEPSTLYVMRLVGLPGEEIHIENGAVHANGIKLDPPELLQGIEYRGEFPEYGHIPWGSKDRPAKLGEDEYFVLGDFTPQASDSRMWERGATGHAPTPFPSPTFAAW